MMSSATRLVRQAPLPNDLVSLLYDRKVIPFVGAGFSAGMGLPDWRELLQQLATEVDSDLSFSEIAEMTNGDNLQIAEYLYLLSDKRIGPLRHVIERLLGSSKDPVRSGAHVELANLGAPQVYTTNYDDLIERTYRALEIPVSVVALPKDVANSDNEKIQVVKYHGDLRHENTLVLTESAYYKRLDLESPMDLKFRSDLLGRSVLFMGYSFRDVNIRLIWFKLMQMMQDIPPDDRRASYIVKVGPNKVEDALFRDVGLTPITLDPTGQIKPSDRSAVLAEYLARLAEKAGGQPGLIPGTTDPMFTSTVLIDRITRSASTRTIYNGRPAPAPPYILRSNYRILERRLPKTLVPESWPAFRTLLSTPQIPANSLNSFLDKIGLFQPASELTTWLVQVLRGGSHELHELRRNLMSNTAVPWALLWSSTIGEDSAKTLITALAEEVDWNKEGHTDEDIVFLSDIISRLIAGQLGEFREPILRAASLQLERARAVYPGIGDIEIDATGRPHLDPLLRDVATRLEEIGSKVGPDEDPADAYLSALLHRQTSQDLFEDKSDDGFHS